jgi:hypothetical protein
MYTLFPLLEKGAWFKIKSKGGPFPIRGHRAVRVSIHFKMSCTILEKNLTEVEHRGCPKKGAFDSNVNL